MVSTILVELTPALGDWLFGWNIDPSQLLIIGIATLFFGPTMTAGFREQIKENMKANEDAIDAIRYPKSL